MRELNPGPAALAICGIFVGVLMTIWGGVLMVIGAIVWHFAEQSKPETRG